LKQTTSEDDDFEFVDSDNFPPRGFDSERLRSADRKYAKPLFSPEHSLELFPSRDKVT
jgi:hypothetical protein